MSAALRIPAAVAWVSCLAAIKAKCRLVNISALAIVLATRPLISLMYSMHD